MGEFRTWLESGGSDETWWEVEIRRSFGGEPTASTMVTAASPHDAAVRAANVPFKGSFNDQMSDALRRRESVKGVPYDEYDDEDGNPTYQLINTRLTVKPVDKLAKRLMRAIQRLISETGEVGFMILAMQLAPRESPSTGTKFMRWLSGLVGRGKPSGPDQQLALRDFYKRGKKVLDVITVGREPSLDDLMAGIDVDLPEMHKRKTVPGKWNYSTREAGVHGWPDDPGEQAFLRVIASGMKDMADAKRAVNAAMEQAMEMGEPGVNAFMAAIKNAEREASAETLPWHIRPGV